MADPFFSEEEIKNILSGPQKEAPKEPSMPQMSQPPAKPAVSIPVRVNPPHTSSSFPSPSFHPIAPPPNYNPLAPARPVLTQKPIPHHTFFSEFVFALQAVFVFILIFVLLYFIVNGPAIWKNLNYFWSGPTETKQTNLTPTQTAALPNNYLTIPKINVSAPIIWDVEPDNILRNLQDGVAQYAGTAHPGQPGNVFLTGHSSYYLWSPGNYKTIFALLGNLETGDKIYIQYQNKTYTYQVTGKEEVSPNNLEVLSQPTEKKLSLMTCVPVGTNFRRLIITAIEI